MIGPAGFMAAPKKKLTADTITDEQIRELRESLPRGHYMIGTCNDALASAHHPQRKRNTRAMCAEYIKSWPSTAKQFDLARAEAK